MTEAERYILARWFAGVLMVGSGMIGAAMLAPDLGLPKQTVALLTVLQAGIGIALGLLPRVQGDGQRRAG